MSEFLLALLSFFLSLGTILAPSNLSGVAKDKIEGNSHHIESPLVEPTFSFQNTSDEKDIWESENKVHPSKHGENHEESNTEKIKAHNTQTPTLTPTQTPTPIPDPELIELDPPVEPIYPPIVIDPPIPPYPCGGGIDYPKPPHPMVYTCLPAY